MSDRPLSPRQFALLLIALGLFDLIDGAERLADEAADELKHELEQEEKQDDR